MSTGGVGSAWRRGTPLAAMPLLSPDFMADYLHLLAMEWKHLSLTVSTDFLREWKDAGPTPLDRPSRFEACRILDPAPDVCFVKKSLAQFRRRFPPLGDVRLSQVWAGMIDAMPDTRTD